MTGQLEHPNIVPVYELAREEEDDQPFYTMALSARANPAGRDRRIPSSPGRQARSPSRAAAQLLDHS